MGKAWKFFCVTFGCKVNQYETESVREAWALAGGEEASLLEEADVLFVNSCAITSRGERDARNALIRLKKENPEAILVLTGCATRLVESFVPRRGAPVPQADVLVFQESKDGLVSGAFPEMLADAARLWPKLGASSRQALAKELEGATKKEGSENAFRSLKRPYPALSINSYVRARPVLKVQDGCRHRCTYCIVPQTRGSCTSRPSDEAVAEAARLFEDHSEIMVSGINLGQYGRDKPEEGDFWSLFEKLGKALAPEFAGRRRFRISSLEPSQIDERAVDILAASPLAAPHLHISLQHASFGVLKRMGRGHYRASTLLDVAQRLKNVWPVMGLGADLIVGFPGETEKDLEELLSFIDASPLTYAHVFPYSRRPGTPAASFAGQIPMSEKAARAKLVREAVERKKKIFQDATCSMKSFLFSPDSIDVCKNGLIHGVNEFYSPCFIEEYEYNKYLDNQDNLIEVYPIQSIKNGIYVKIL